MTVPVRVFLGWAAAAALSWAAASAEAQSSSLYGPANGRRPLRLEDTSWYYIRVEPPRQLKLNDLVTVIVDERSQVVSEGEVDRRKNAQVNAVLTDWIRLDGLDVKKAPQASGDPRIKASLDNRYRAQSDLETRDSMKFRIAARVVDIRPNGHLVLEAHREIHNNSELWRQSLSGVVRPEDVLPNNTVLSEDVAELRIDKQESGHVRDGYRRGWLLKALDKYAPF